MSAASMTSQPATQHSAQATYRRLINGYNIYRLIVACTIIGSHYLLASNQIDTAHNDRLFLIFSATYLIIALALIGLTQIQWPKFHQLIRLKTMLDIICIILLMYAMGGEKTGLGILLIITIAAAGSISNGRFALFYAALASVGLLLEHSVQTLNYGKAFEGYSYAVMLCLSCFATASLAKFFGRRLQQTDYLDRQQEIDLKNLAQINALISQKIPEGVMVVDKYLKIRHFNTHALNLLGITNSPRLGTDLSQANLQLTTLLQNWISLHHQDDQPIKFN